MEFLMAKKAKTDPGAQLASTPPNKADLKFLSPSKAAASREDVVHVYGKGGAIVCETDARGFPTPENRSPLELVVDASEGFIPLWAKGVTLRWRFQEASIRLFADPEGAKTYLRTLLAEGLLLWKGSVPVRFTEAHDAWDFEIVVRAQSNCSHAGCTLARAFFPDQGRHELVLFPTLFEQSHAEQVETMAHELGHIFGLRHFFAQISETAWPSELFGKHHHFSIMNYGASSRMTDADRSDLANLYTQVWAGTLTAINGTPIRQVQPFSSLRTSVAPQMVFAGAATAV
jgi:hypothetical protein